MKGLQPIFLGIFGIFAFSWLGMIVVPNMQIGSLNPQADEEGTDIYPMPPSGMAAHGAEVYAANGCVYCHSQQVRPEYGGSDIERKWGDRRSGPRDYIFQRVVFLGKMRTGPDLANVGHRPSLTEGVGAKTDEKGAVPAAGAPTEASPAPGASPGASAAPESSPAASPGAAASPAASPASAAATPPVATNPAAEPSPAPNANPAAAAAVSPAGSPGAVTGAPGTSAAAEAPSMVANVKALTANGQPVPYTAAWHHRHLYNPRSLVENSNMPAYRFLYEKRRVSGEASPDAINFAGSAGDELEKGWQIVPSYDAKCLVAYLMSLDQSHALKEAKAPPTIAPSPAKEKENEEAKK